jgi:hypothetical protein
MDASTFIIELSKSVAWPISIFFVALLLKKPITQILPLLKRLKIGAFEGELRDNLRAADEKSETLPLKQERGARAKQKDGASPLLAGLVELAEKSPTAAMLEAWRNVEYELYALSSRFLPEKKGLSSLASIQELAAAKKINEDAKSLLLSLKVVRNEVAHPPGKIEISEQQAATFIQSAVRAIEYLKGIGSKQGREGAARPNRAAT